VVGDFSLFKVKALFLVMLLVFSEYAHACSVCFGDPDSALTKGIVSGVWVLLAVIVTVLIGFGYFIFHLSRKGKERL
jgi:hypothetical protein